MISMMVRAARYLPTTTSKGRTGTVIKSLAGSHTVLLSTHILQEVTATCDRVILINRGRIVADDKLVDLVQKHRPGEGKESSLEQVFLQLTEN